MTLLAWCNCEPNQCYQNKVGGECDNDIWCCFRDFNPGGVCASLPNYQQARSGHAGALRMRPQPCSPTWVPGNSHVPAELYLWSSRLRCRASSLSTLMFVIVLACYSMSWYCVGVVLLWIACAMSCVNSLSLHIILRASWPYDSLQFGWAASSVSYIVGW